MSGRVVCAGDLMLDVVVRGRAPEPGGDAPAAIALHGGGSAANTAAWLAATGSPVTWCGAVGDDAAGRTALAELEAAGVRTAATVVAARPTGVCVVLIGEDGERTMRSDRGANAAAPVPALPPGTAWLHVSGYADAATLVAAGREAGVPVSVDPGPAGTAVADADLLLPSLVEAQSLTGETDPERAALALGTEAFVTLGAEGALWTDGTRLLHRRAEPAAVVDTAGAGDAFAAGVLAARLHGSGPEGQLEAGLRLASRCVATAGARPQSAA